MRRRDFIAGSLAAAVVPGRAGRRKSRRKGRSPQ